MGSVEKVIPYSFIKVDLFNFIDLVAVREGHSPVFIQVTSRGHVSDRIAKSRKQEEFYALSTGADFWVVGVDVADGQNRMKWVRVLPTTQHEEEGP